MGVLMSSIWPWKFWLGGRELNKGGTGDVGFANQRHNHKAVICYLLAFVPLGRGGLFLATKAPKMSKHDEIEKIKKT